MTWISPNFAFLAQRDPLLHRYASLAERSFADDPNGTIVRMRQFVEALTHATASGFGNPASTTKQLADVIRGLDYRVPERIVALLHELRRLGNPGVHDNLNDHRHALACLKLGHQLAGWYHTTFAAKGFKLAPFVIPPDPAAATRALAEELAALRAEAARSAAALASLQESATVLGRLQAEAEAKAAHAFSEMEVALDLAAEAERARSGDRERFEHEISALRAVAPSPPPAPVAEVAAVAAVAAEAIELDEASTRQLIDDQLRLAGWEVDSQVLRWSSGTRPQKGKNLAIAEVPTSSGPVDYVLFVGLRAFAVVEAKRGSVDVPGVLQHQAERYARDLAPATVGHGDAWGLFRVPFAFASNGRPYLAQVKTKSGIWFRDLRDDTNLARPLMAWWSPEGMEAAAALKPGESEAALAAEPFDDLGLYDFQVDVVKKVEAAIAGGDRSLLVAMATGTGKTRTALGFIYRALKSGRFRRALFVVDRTSLGDQSFDVVESMKVDGNDTIQTAYDVMGLEDAVPAADTRLHFATIQGLVRRVLYSDAPPPVDQYDLIVVDECHRGYSLDREMSDDDLTFRSADDFVSKYRRVLDYFDAVKVGLTATPALHTTQIFGNPVVTYSYRQAVIDGRLIDHEPPLRIVTKLAEDGVEWNKGDVVPRIHLKTGAVDMVVLPDEVDVEVDDFNSRVMVPAFNAVICTELAKHLDPNAPGKTLVFCARDDHADIVVQGLKEELTNRWGPIANSLVQKITGRVDNPRQAILHFKNEHDPKIVVTVDLLTTGIDVPKIVNIVFLRRVRSRILYEQMLGRATRRCDEIGKEVFRIFDCVDLYGALEEYSTMRPVVKPQTGSFRRIIEDLAALKDVPTRQDALDQFLARWNRKLRLVVGEAAADFTEATSLAPAGVTAHIKALALDEASTWLTEHIEAFVEVDAIRPPSDPTMLIAVDDDEHRATTHGYGKAEKPSDYLDGFHHFLVSHMNELPALTVVLQRPRELTRKQLKELALALDKAGYPERTLRTAWRDLTNQDIGATIVGHIRRAALGSPLEPYAMRVERAHAHILQTQPWSPHQRMWLQRFANQLKQETVLDRESLDRDQFAAEGGYAQINKAFAGRVEDTLAEFTDALWADTA